MKNIYSSIDTQVLRSLLSLVEELETNTSAASNLARHLAVRPFENSQLGLLSRESGLTEKENAFKWIAEHYDLCVSANGAILALTESAATLLSDLSGDLGVALLAKEEGAKNRR